MKVLIICGPTATGKTALAVHLARLYNGELVSADSRQIYRGMDIGTGKDISKNDQVRMRHDEFLSKAKTYTIPQYTIDGIPLWMYDVVDPDEAFSVAQYQDIGRQVIADIRSRGKLPILVGGTGLYIQSLIHPVETAVIPPNTALRKELETYSLEALSLRLQKEDVAEWNRLNHSERNNPRRLIRKIEIAIGRNKKTPHHPTQREHMGQTNDICMIGLMAPLSILYQRIDKRVEKRVKEGIEKEIQTLLAKGYTWDLPSMNTFGYREWKENIKPSTRLTESKRAFSVQLSEKQKEKIIQQWKWDEHGYARRQMTWFRKQQGVQWFDVQDPSVFSLVERVVSSWYNTPTYAHKS